MQAAHLSQHVMPFALQKKTHRDPFPPDSQSAKMTHVMTSPLDPSPAVRFHALNATEDAWSAPFVHAGSPGSTMVDFEALLTPCTIAEPMIDATADGHLSDSERFVTTAGAIIPSKCSATAPIARSESNSFSYSQSHSASNSYSLSHSFVHSQSDSQSQLHTTVNDYAAQPGGALEKQGGRDTSPSQDSPKRKIDLSAPKSRAEIRRARAARNRSSARRSRLRKKAESERDKENAQLVEKRNALLKEQVRELHEKMISLQRVAEALGLPQPSLVLPHHMGL